MPPHVGDIDERKLMTHPARLAAMLFGLTVAVPIVIVPCAGRAQTAATQPSAPAPTTPQPAAPPTTAPQGSERQSQVYYHAAAGDAFSGRGRNGEPVCGVGTTSPADRHALALRFDIGGDDTIFAASKPDWAVPDGAQITVVMQIGLNPPWTVRASGHGAAIEWTLDRAAIQAFDAQFRNARSMTVTFPDGNEPPWALSLAGSTAISNAFGRCITDLTRQYQAAQPQGANAPPPAAPTQPFTPPPPR
jgi:hypothetical protein